MTSNPLKKLFEQCLDELTELSNVVVEEWSTPDVVQEYLQNVVNGFGSKLAKLDHKNKGVEKCPVRRKPSGTLRR